MIQKIGGSILNNGQQRVDNRFTKPAVNTTNAITTPNYSKNYTATSLVNAYQAFNNIKTSKTVSFGQSLASFFDKFSKTMYTCNDETQVVGTRYPSSELINKYYWDLPHVYDAIKTDKEISRNKDDGTVSVARMQLKRTPKGVMHEMALRKPRKINAPVDKNIPLSQLIRVTADPNIKEKASILNTKGKLMAVVEDGDYVLLTNAGNIKKKAMDGDRLEVSAQQSGNVFKPFVPEVQPVQERTRKPSIGKGTDIVIGMENGRFCPEIIKSIEDFITKIDNGEIVLNQFVANPDAKNIQLAMLAGGFGSRAEYTNASSEGIFHAVKNGAQSTKGVFRTATGLTPMETTFITLHNAGLLDCNNLNIGDNIKLYLNRSGVNKGNGGFTVDLYDKMEREGRNSLAIFPNDSMSRMPKATAKMTDIMNSGDAAVVMIAKEVDSDVAKGNFGIMKLGDNNEILEFAEKPKQIPDGYEKGGKCLTNTFQFSVSKEAFKALDIVQEYFPSGGSEPKDWSGTFIPTLMALTQLDNPDEINEYITKALNVKKKTVEDWDIVKIPDNIIAEAKNVLGNQKIIAVPTDEPWADCGTLNQLYHTTMQIASNDFPLEDFERKHVLDSINTQTGLVASTPEMKEYIEQFYDIDGEVMVAPKATKIDPAIVEEYIDKGLISVNEKQI